MSRVDVIVPCYNYAKYLRECVTSVCTQRAVDVRVLIIDDASPDNTPEVAAALTQEDRRVEYRRHAENQGHIATYNEGLEWASGDYLLLLSADDLLTPGALARASRLLDAHPEVGFTYGRAITTNNPVGHSPADVDDCRWRVLLGAEYLRLCCVEAANLVSTPTAVVRTEVQHAVGGYRKELPHTGDLEMWARIAAHRAVGVVDADQAFYRVHGANMHKTDYKSALTIFEQHWEAFEILFREQGSRVAGKEQLEQAASRGTALGGLRKASALFEAGDVAGCELLLAKILIRFPQLKNEKAWARFRLKRRLGRRLWNALSALARSIRAPQPIDSSPFGRTGVFSGV
jgi:hypothetical protein